MPTSHPSTGASRATTPSLVPEITERQGRATTFAVISGGRMPLQDPGDSVQVGRRGRPSAAACWPSHKRPSGARMALIAAAITAVLMVAWRARAGAPQAVGSTVASIGTELPEPLGTPGASSLRQAQAGSPHRDRNLEAGGDPQVVAQQLNSDTEAPPRHASTAMTSEAKLPAEALLTAPPVKESCAGVLPPVPSTEQPTAVMSTVSLPRRRWRHGGLPTSGRRFVQFCRAIFAECTGRCDVDTWAPSSVSGFVRSMARSRGRRPWSRIHCTHIACKSLRCTDCLLKVIRCPTKPRSAAPAPGSRRCAKRLNLARLPRVAGWTPSTRQLSLDSHGSASPGPSATRRSRSPTFRHGPSPPSGARTHTTATGSTSSSPNASPSRHGGWSVWWSRQK